MKTKMSIIEDALVHAVAKAEKAKVFVEDNCAEMIRVAAQLDDLGAKNPVTMSVDVASETLDISMSGNKIQLEGLVAALRKVGYKPDNRPADKIFTSWTTWWRNEDEELQLYVTFYSTICKRVKIGSKMVDTPQYEIQCE